MLGNLGGIDKIGNQVHRSQGLAIQIRMQNTNEQHTHKTVIK